MNSIDFKTAQEFINFMIKEEIEFFGNEFEMYIKMEERSFQIAKKIENQVEGMKKLIKYLGVKKPNFIGMSTGNDVVSCLNLYLVNLIESMEGFKKPAY